MSIRMLCCLATSFIAFASMALALMQNPKGEQYAFLVGCSKYDPDELAEIPFGVSELEEFRQLLLTSGYPEANIKFLRDDAERRFISEKKQILTELKLILKRAKKNDTILIALNGHGVQFKGDETGYFCPLDAKLMNKESLIPTQEIYDLVKECKASQKVILINACRNDPTSATSQAANRINLTDKNQDKVPEGIAALYSCDEGEKSYFYDPKNERFKDRRRSFFYHQVMETWKEANGDLTVDEFFAKVTSKTAADADRVYGKAQNPVVRRELQGEGQWKLFARKEVVNRPEMKKAEPKVKPKTNAKELTFDLGKGVKLEMVRIPKGKFLMGSTKDEEGRYDSEGPEHEVTLTKDFYLGKYEVTQEQWEALMGSNPSDFKLKNGPVDHANWEDCQEYIKKLNAKVVNKVGTFRLPTEAEWEYACRAESKTRYSFGNADGDLGEHAWYNKNSDGKTHEVGTRKPNGFGLHDMHGNVWEWCSNWHDQYPSEAVSDPTGPSTGSYRVLRGGSWSDNSRLCRSASRYRNAPSWRFSYLGLGFRLALVPSE
jgi:formylglycine-generating enzyme required for sulfatase activity